MTECPVVFKGVGPESPETGDPARPGWDVVRIPTEAAVTLKPVGPKPPWNPLTCCGFSPMIDRRGTPSQRLGSPKIRTDETLSSPTSSENCHADGGRPVIPRSYARSRRMRSAHPYLPAGPTRDWRVAGEKSRSPPRACSVRSPHARRPLHLFARSISSFPASPARLFFCFPRART